MGSHTSVLRGFRHKPPFKGVCSTCKKKKEVRSIHLRDDSSGRSALFSIKFFREAVDLCMECCKKIPGKNAYKMKEMTPEELAEKIKALEAVPQKEISPVQSRPNRFNFTGRKAVHKSSAQGGQ